MSPELEKHLGSSLVALGNSGISISNRMELPYGVQLKLNRDNLSCAVNLYYSKKKGISTVGSGGDRSLLAEALSILSVNSTPTDEKLLNHGVRTGTDEAGKGDYFGPLVAAAVTCGDEACREMISMGVGDSKRFSRPRVRELYEKITEMKSISYSVHSISPVEYNSLFAGFSQRRMNSLDMLAKAHGSAISDEIDKGAVPAKIIVDKFCEMKRLKPWLPAEHPAVELLVRAEDKEPAVAAASIIARSVYLDQLAVLSAKFSVELTPGAGASVDHIGRKLLAAKGESVLIETAKLHFANTLRITSRT